MFGDLLYERWRRLLVDSGAGMGCGVIQAGRSYSKTRRRACGGGSRRISMRDYWRGDFSGAGSSTAHNASQLKERLKSGFIPSRLVLLAFFVYDLR